MSRFLDQARNLWDVAGAAAASGLPDATHTILFLADSGIRMVSDSDWPLDSLQAFHGAQTAYRVTCSEGGTRVEGRTQGQSCVLAAETPGAVARRMLVDRPAYLLNSVVSPGVTGEIASR